MNTPNFQTGKLNPFGLTNVGSYSAPTFADVDADGDADAIVGSVNGNVSVYRYTGNPDRPFDAPITLINSFNNLGYSAPTFGDIDGDGDLDAFVGADDGNIYFFPNTGNANVPMFNPAQLIQNPFGLEDVGDFSKPTLVDIDGDGDLDAFVGAADGKTSFFRNTMNDFKYELLRWDGDEGKVLVAPIHSEPRFEFMGLFDLGDVGSYSSPTFADVDGDGDFDALVGAADGNTYFFQNEGDAQNPKFAEPVVNPFGLGDVGSYSSPTFADIDRDGDLDAIVGNADGNAVFFRNGLIDQPVNTIVGTGAAEILSGSIGRDAIFGRGNNDTLNGRADEDILNGEGGNDILNGGIDDDTLNGGAGNDVLNGGTGSDSMNGGGGNDTYLVDSVGDLVTEAAGDGTDLVESSISYTLGANVENLTLTGTSRINGTGNGGRNVITGNSVANTLDGRNGNDDLLGGGGNDVLIGGNGSDELTGSAGSDQFVFRSGKVFVLGDFDNDTITDFSGSDKIVLSRASFTQLASAVGAGFSNSSDFEVVSTDADAARSTALIVYSSGSGELFYNQNGAASRFGSGGRFATLTGAPTLAANDFVIQA